MQDALRRQLKKSDTSDPTKEFKMVHTQNRFNTTANGLYPLL